MLNSRALQLSIALRSWRLRAPLVPLPLVIPATDAIGFVLLSQMNGFRECLSVVVRSPRCGRRPVNAHQELTTFCIVPVYDATFRPRYPLDIQQEAIPPRL